ncbi:hypothetical protein ACFSTD_16305 [Novosphingobium colocasiae]
MSWQYPRLLLSDPENATMSRKVPEDRHSVHNGFDALGLTCARHGSTARPPMFIAGFDSLDSMEALPAGLSAGAKISAKNIMCASGTLPPLTI